MSSPPTPKTPKTPRTPITPTSIRKKIEFVYGSPLEELNSNFPKITDCDLIRYWTHIYDEYRGISRDMQKTDKHEVTKKVAKYLISLWESKSLETLCEKNVITKVSRVVNRVQEMIRLSTYENNRQDSQWISVEKNIVLSRGFDITNYSIVSEVSPSVSGTKRKVEEMVIFDFAIQFLVSERNHILK